MHSVQPNNGLEVCAGWTRLHSEAYTGCDAKKLHPKLAAVPISDGYHVYDGFYPENAKIPIFSPPPEILCA